MTFSLNYVHKCQNVDTNTEPCGTSALIIWKIDCEEQPYSQTLNKIFNDDKNV